MTVTLVTDTAATIPAEVAARLGVVVVPLRLTIGAETYRDGGQGGFEIRTYIAIAAAAGGTGELQYYTAELPIFAVGCTVARFDLARRAAAA